MFQDFLYSNLRLGPPKGMEDRVATIHAFKGTEYITACYAFSPEELAEINKTGVVWLSMLAKSWPPLKVDAFIPAHNPARDVIIIGEEFIKSEACQVLNYLDLSLITLRVDPDEEGFIWKHIPGGGTHEGKPIDVYDLEYRNHGGGFTHHGGKYMFGEMLEIIGKVKDVERLQPLKLLYPYLTDDMLILMQKPKGYSGLVGPDGERIN